MPNPNRPKVGPADPETRRKMLRQKLDEPTRGEGVAPQTPPAAKPKKKTATLRRLLDPSESRESTHDGETLDDVVSKAVDNAPKRPTR